MREGVRKCTGDSAAPIEDASLSEDVTLGDDVALSEDAVRVTIGLVP